jgi:MFS_1 like family
LVLQQLTDRSEFGKMRLWGLIGAGLGSIMGGYFLEGMPIDMEGAAGRVSILNLLYLVYNHLVGYRLLFFAHIVLHIPVFVAIRSFQQDQRDNTARRAKEKANSASHLSTGEVLMSLLTDRDSIVFFIMVYSMGVAGGIADNFTYARFREVGASGKSMGSSRLFSSAVGAVMFWYSGPVNSFLGTQSVLLLSLLTVTLRFRLYAVMDHVWYAYVGEGLRGLTFGCFWSSATVYCSELAPTGARSTLLLLLNGAYNGIGRSTGAVLGGQMRAYTGDTGAVFRHCSVGTFTLAAIFAVYRSTVFPSPPKAKDKLI